MFGSVWGAVMANKSAMAAQSEPKGTSSQRCQRRAGAVGGGIEDAARGAFGAGEETAGHQSEGGERGEGVILLAGGQGEEAEDEAGPEEEGEGGLEGRGQRQMVRRNTRFCRFAHEGQPESVLSET